jgi:putative transport protein
MDFLIATLQRYPELAIFASIAIGYWVGGVKVGGFSLGTVTGTLLAAILIGQLGIEVSADVKSIFFIMFLFAVGYGVGPQFVRGVSTDGLPQAIFAVVISGLCLASVYAAAKIAGYDVGFAAGLLAGSQTISASIGVATDALNGLGMPEEQVKEITNRIPVAYAVTYIWGTIGTGVILAFLGPRLLGIDLVAECKRYEKELSAGGPEGGMQSAYRRLDIRAYRFGDQFPPGMTVADAESRLASAGDAVRIFVERLRRDGTIVEFTPTTVLQPGDVVAVSGRTEVLIEAFGKYGNEVSDPELLEMPAEAVDVVLTNKAYDGKTLIELAKTDFARGVYLTKITRGATSVNIPVLAQTKVYRADILRIGGTRANTEAAARNLGYADRPTSATDMVFVGLGIVLGGLVGAIVVPVMGIPITLSTSGGALISGIVIGWLRGVYPTFGRIPAPTLWFMNNVGLNVFIAVVGLTAGPTFVAGIKEAGIGLFLWGFFATSVPMLLAPWIGKYIFKFDPAINLGCCGGARTSTASAAMIGEVAKSDVPLLGYTVPYAVSNTLLTMWGLIIVLMLT